MQVQVQVLEILQIQSIDASVGFLLLLGMMVGILSGLLGVGGGVLLTPALHVLGMPMPLAVGTTLTQMVASSFTGASKHFRQKNIVFPIALVFGLPALLGVWFGRNVMVFLDRQGSADTWTSLLYIGFLGYIGYNMYRRTQRMVALASAQNDPTKLHPRPRLLRRLWLIGPRLKWKGFESIPIVTPVLLGLSVGLISSLTGLGGGFFYVPVMISFLSLSTTQAIGTSLVCVFLGSLVGAIGYFFADMVDVPVAVTLAIASSIGGVIGASATQYVKGHSIRYLFTFLVWTAAVSMIFRRVGFPTASYYLLFSSAALVVVLAVANAIYHYLVARA
ncbi:MAG: sulfite exporter TauE/SafE family protein [Oligoflexus sp.]